MYKRQVLKNDTGSDLKDHIAHGALASLTLRDLSTLLFFSRLLGNVLTLVIHTSVRTCFVCISNVIGMKLVHLSWVVC